MKTISMSTLNLKFDKAVFFVGMAVRNTSICNYCLVQYFLEILTKSNSLVKMFIIIYP